MGLFYLSNPQQGEKSWSGSFLFWDLRLDFQDASSRRLMGMRRRRGMDTPMRPHITRRRRLVWGSGLGVGGVVGGGGEGVLQLGSGRCGNAPSNFTMVVSCDERPTLAKPRWLARRETAEQYRD